METTAWLTIAAVCTSGAMSPGPSLAVVVKNTVARGRRDGVLTGIGHGLGVGLYAFGAVAGLQVLIQGYERVLTTLGALYLVWMGARILVATWRARPAPRPSAAESEQGRGARSGFLEGFLIAFLNPKIAVFFLALLAQFVPAEAGFVERTGVALLAMAIDTTWYVVAALALAASGAARLLDGYGVWLDRLFGLLIAAIGATMFVREWV